MDNARVSIYVLVEQLNRESVASNDSDKELNKTFIYRRCDLWTLEETTLHITLAV